MEGATKSFLLVGLGRFFWQGYYQVNELETIEWKLGIWAKMCNNWWTWIIVNENLSNWYNGWKWEEQNWAQIVSTQRTPRNCLDQWSMTTARQFPGQNFLFVNWKEEGIALEKSEKRNISIFCFLNKDTLHFLWFNGRFLQFWKEILSIMS